MGWDYRTFQRGRRKVKTRVFVRRVFGEVRLEQRTLKTWTDVKAGPKELAYVPLLTAQWLETALVWGGKRHGAGRKNGVGLMKESSVPRADLIKGTAVITNKQNTTTGEHPFCERMPAEGGVYLQAEKLGTFTGNIAAVPAPTYDTCLEGVPPFPDFDVVMPARIPSPPHLDPNESTDNNAQLLDRAYRQALQFRLGMTTRSARNISRSKNYKALVRAVEDVLSAEVDPTSWAVWSATVWKDFACKGRKLRRPTVAWMFSAKRLKERAGWFRRESRQLGGQLIYGKKHRELLSRYARMHSELRKTPRGDVAAIVDHHFPPRATYDQLVNAARAEADANRRRYETILSRGGFIWT